MSVAQKKYALIAAVAAILLLAIALRLARWAQLDYQPNDSYGYCLVAEEIARDGWQSVTALQKSSMVGLEMALHKPPFLTGIMALGVRAGGKAATVGLALNFFCGILCVIFLGLTAWELFGDYRYALGAMFLAAVMPILVRYSCVILREMPYWCWSCAALWAAVRAAKREECRYWWSMFGIFAALAILSRKEGVELVAAFAVYVALFDWRRGAVRMVLCRKIQMVLAVAVPLFVILVPIQLCLNRCGWNWQVIPWERFVFYFIR